MRALVAGLALLCMLLHAGLVVRHASAMVAQLELSPMAFGIMCHGQNRTPVVPDAPPSIPDQDEAQNDCPLCMCMGSVVALLPSHPQLTPRLDAASARIEIVAEIVAPRLSPVCPPARGPPVVA